MRVLFWSELFWPHIGGAEIFAQHLIRSLSPRGHIFTIVTSHTDRPLPDEELQEGTSICRFPFRAALAGRFDSFRQSLAGVAALAERLQPDLVHMNAVGPSSVFYLRSPRLTSIPLVLTLQQEVLESQKRHGESLLAQILGRADRIVGCSEAALGEALRIASGVLGRSEVIWNGVTPPDLAIDPLPFAPARLLCIGRLVPAKGFDTALAAFARVAEEFPDLTLDIAGDGLERGALQALAIELGLGSRVRFLGWVEPKDVYRQLNRATLVLMPSRREGLPVTAVQAALMGRPIIASNVGGLPEVVDEGETGVLVEPDAVNGLATGIRARLIDAEGTRRMGARARESACSRFAWDRTVTRYEAAYRACRTTQHEGSLRRNA